MHVCKGVKGDIRRRGREGEGERGREGEGERGREGEGERGREGEGDRGREGEGERGREREKERICVSLCTKRPIYIYILVIRGSLFKYKSLISGSCYLDEVCILYTKSLYTIKNIDTYFKT